jgi:predicted transcriptional regulator
MQISKAVHQIKQNLTASGIGLRSFAKIAGMPLSTLHAVLDGKFGLRPEKEQKLLQLSIRCLETAESLRPLTFLERGSSKPLETLILAGKTPEEIRSLINEIFQ